MRYFRFPNIRCNNTVLVVLGLTFFTLSWLSCHFIHDHPPRESLWDKAGSEERIEVLQTKIRFLEMESQKQRDRIKSLQDVLSGKVNENDLISSDEGNPFYEEIMTRLKRKSGKFEFVKPEADPEPLQASLTYNTMPHLMRNPKSRCPAFQILSPRKGTDIDVVIGIPTVKRDKENYLADTVKSLIDGMTAAEQQSTLIVVYIGEVDLSYVVDTAYELNVLFPRQFGHLIEVISPTQYWYPEWDSVQATLGDSQKRTLWRTKQNLDAIFLMSYVQNKGSYYLMLEDDVVAKKGYMANIKEFIAQQPKRNQWFFIDFSNTGGIGKLVKMEDLMFFSSYVQIFYQYMPIDWLIELFLADRVCGLENDAKQCSQLKGNIRPIYKTSLFEHAGLYSSLRGKIQKVRPSLRKGRDKIKFYPHKNPPVESVFSNIESDKEHTIERAYNGLDFFWGIKPKLNDTIEFWFKQPLKLDKFFFRTGNIIRQKDIITNGSVEVLPEGQETFIHVDDFDEFGTAENHISSSIGPLSAIRIRLLEDSVNWVIISEIELRPLKTT